jgi:FAD/FMN-containing dehydrogenase
LTDCLGQKNVPIKLTSDGDWNVYAATYNTRLQNTPNVIVIPITQQHIQDAVLCASHFGIKVQPKGGGHSYASFSTLQGGMMIDLENLQNVSVDSSGLATVGAGLRLGNMAEALYNQAGRALSHGTCPGVGLGHFLHGGFGYSSRAWGLALDAIVALDVVLANGTFIHATTTAYPDIYYAMRGAGDSFGIVVNFYLQTQPAPTTVINWSYSLPNMFSDVPTTVAAFQHIQDFALNSSVVDRKLGFGMYMDGHGFSISGTYFGTQSDFTNIIAPELLRTLPTPSSSSVQAVGWIQSLTLLGGASTITTPVHGYNAHDNFYAKSVTVPESTPLTAAALTSYFTYISNQGVNPPVPWFSIINLYGGPDSQINTKTVDFAAYSDRNSLWVAQHYAFTDLGATYPASATNFVDGLNTAMTSQMPGTTFGAYLNYVDPDLSAADAHNLYYGASLYAKLKTIKLAVDPGNVFANPQSI